MLCFISILCIIISVMSSSVPLQCYSGWQIFGEGDETINNVTLVTCKPHHNCCFFLASLPGNNYNCYSNCPKATEQCGPDPNSGIQDIFYCYCKNYRDKKCQPYFGEDTPDSPTYKRR